MDNVRRIEREDYNSIYEWFRGWDLPPPPVEFLSNVGFIVPGVAAGYLYITNSKIGIIDSYISNVKASKMERKEAIDMITSDIITLAKELGIKILKCDSTYESIKVRAKNFGFKEIGNYTCFAKEI